MLSATGLRSFLDEALERMSEKGLSWKSDPLLVQVLKETAGPKRMDHYIAVLNGYRSRGIRIIDYWDGGYPERLRHISNPPLVLFVRGQVFPGSSPVAIVGTRTPSPRGVTLAHEFGSFFAERGHTIVSGLAWGIDSAAHTGALDAGGTTVAILAGHVEHIYPKANTDLAAAIVKRGALVSEVSPEVVLHKGRFVERNRITSGLAHAVIVVESVRSGGTLQQVRFAIGQGRPTYVVDQSDFENPETKEGFQRLREMGATPIRNPTDVRILSA